VALAFTTVCFGQKLTFQQAQTRVIEPLQDVFVRPLVADLEIIKSERMEYPRSWEYNFKKLTEMTVEELEDAKTLAAYKAAKLSDADVIVGATFQVSNHVENGKPTEYGVDVIVRGYPAKYTNWHNMGSKPEDEKWVTHLLRAQEVYINRTDRKKSQAVK
jgi:hypothetical protein